MSDTHVTSIEQPTGGSINGPLLSLELRVRKLEDSLAPIQNVEQFETRVIERVSERVMRDSSLGPRESASVVIDAARKMLPVAKLISAGPDANGQAPRSRERLGWFFWDAYTECRAIIRMYFDRRYRLSWKAKAVPLILLAAVFTSYYWFPLTSVPLVDKIVDLIIAYFLFKIVTREARRYRMTAADLPLTLRL